MNEWSIENSYGRICRGGGMQDVNNGYPVKSRYVYLPSNNSNGIRLSSNVIY